jgi:hypothetical protein
MTNHLGGCSAPTLTPCWTQEADPSKLWMQRWGAPQESFDGLTKWIHALVLRPIFLPEWPDLILQQLLVGIGTPILGSHPLHSLRAQRVDFLSNCRNWRGQPARETMQGRMELVASKGEGVANVGFGVGGAGNQGWIWVGRWGFSRCLDRLSHSTVGPFHY